MNAATYSADSVFRVVERERLFDASAFRNNGGSGLSHQYDVAEDGRFIMMTRAGRTADPGMARRVIQIQNWFTELEELLGDGR